MKAKRPLLMYDVVVGTYIKNFAIKDGVFLV